MVSNDELSGLHEARGYQYPVWQRLQWLGGSEEDGFDEEVCLSLRLCFSSCSL